MKDVFKDFKDLLELLNKHEVNYLIVGAHAMSFWGYSRATGDLDVLVGTDPENAEQLIQSLKEFGAPMKNIDSADFSKPEQVIQLGLPPLRIDLLTSISGVTNSAAFSSAIKGKLLGIPVQFLELKLLIKNKKSLNRPKDQLDVLELKQIKKGRKK